MKKKIDVADLELGMYVVELDRPWLETPFLFQGFPIDSGADIEALKRYCHQVYIEVEDPANEDIRPRLQTLDTPPSAAVVSAAVAAPRPQPGPNGEPRVYRVERPFEQEIAYAGELRARARELIEGVFDDIRARRSIDAQGAKALVRKTAESIIRSPDAQMWLTQLKNKDEYTSIHCMNVCILALTFGRHLGLPEDALNIMGLGALLHDVGKICVPLEVLNKPGKLTPEEFEIMKRHPVDGLEIVSRTPGVPAGAIDVVFSHHERYSGSGYPRGLVSKEINLFTKIVAIVDVYDAVTSNRVYHHGMDIMQATKLLYEGRDRDFDAGLIEQFIQCLGAYPVGSLVELNTGEVGIVLSFPRDQTNRPKLLMILDGAKQYHQPPYVLDLVQHPPTGDGAVTVTASLGAGSYGINVIDYVPLVEQIVK